MPRIQQKKNEYLMADFTKEVRRAGFSMGLNTLAQIAEHTGLNYDTLRGRMQKPETFKLPEVMVLLSELHMGEDGVKPFLEAAK